MLNTPEMPADIANYPLLDPIDGWAVIVIITLVVLVVVLYLRNRENAKGDHNPKLPAYLPPYVRPEQCGRHKVGVCYRCCPCDSCSATRIMEEQGWTE